MVDFLHNTFSKISFREEKGIVVENVISKVEASVDGWILSGGEASCFENYW